MEKKKPRKKNASKNSKRKEKADKNSTQNLSELGAFKLSGLLEMYAIINQQQQYEGIGIWERFNIMFSVNIVLFGVVAFIFTDQPPNWENFLIAISIIGLLLSIWSGYVLQRLWFWHRHWVDTLQTIEKGFPDVFYWPRPFTRRPAYLLKKKRWYVTALLSYTQPFFMLIGTIWMAIIVFISIIPSTPTIMPSTLTIMPSTPTIMPSTPTIMPSTPTIMPNTPS